MRVAFVQQVSWSIGPGGPTTVASSNTEHSPYILRYPERRRAELLSPDKTAAAANADQRRTLETLYGTPKVQ